MGRSTYADGRWLRRNSGGNIMFRPDRSGRRWRRFVILAMTGLLLWQSSIQAKAAETIQDPKAWADNIIRIITTRNADDILNTLGAATSAEKKANLKVELGQLWELLPTAGDIVSTDLIAQREWGKSLVMYWYYLDFENKVLVVSLRFRKRGNGWEVNQFNFTNDMDDAKLP
jgi:hypothetical protein